MSAAGREGVDAQLEELTEVLVAYANLDFEPMPSVRGDGPLDAVAVGLQMLGEELQSAVSARRDAESRNQAKSEFLESLSHELRTPLTSIITGTELMLADGADREYLEYILREANHLKRLMNDLLDLSNVEAGSFVVRPAPFSLHRLIEDLRVEYASVAESKQIALRFRGPPSSTPTLLGDQARLRQVLSNLIENALKYTMEGEVEIRTSATVEGGSAALVVEVQDTGIGVPAEALGLIFERFTRADNARRTEAPGTGIGLFVARALVEAMDGRLQVDSSPAGSTFRLDVVLPVLQAGERGPSREPAAPPPFEEALNCSVLLVEDNPAVRRLVAASLTQMGVRLRTARDGVEALEMYRPGSFDLVLMDCRMPRMTGFEAAAAIRDLHPEDPTPIIALTAHAMTHAESTFREVGMNGCLTKPFDTRRLREVVMSLGVAVMDPSSS